MAIVIPAVACALGARIGVGNLRRQFGVTCGSRIKSAAQNSYRRANCITRGWVKRLV
jgi:hypothetical protein